MRDPSSRRHWRCTSVRADRCDRGALAATARKQPGRHPRAGRVYLWAVGGIFATATIMAAIRWHEDAHLFAIAVIAFSLYGYRARRRHRPGWSAHHAIGMGGSYIALLTGFYVDNGPFLPLWDRLPHIAYWLLPSLVGVPIIWRALRRFAIATTDEPNRHPSHARGANGRTEPLASKFAIKQPPPSPSAKRHDARAVLTSSRSI